MSWFSRAKSFVAKTPARAEDLEAEFDNIAEAFSGFGADAAVAKADLNLTGSYQDVPGATVGVVATVDSKLLVIASFYFEALGTSDGMVGTINIGGSDQEARAYLLPRVAGGAAVATQTYEIPLSPGSYTVQMRARFNSGTGGKCWSTFGNTRLSYVLVPA